MGSLFSTKSFIICLSVSSIIFAGTMKDIKSHTVKKVSKLIVAEEIVPVERNVASLDINQVAQIYLPVNKENSKKINTSWEIVRIVSADEKVAFDKYNNPEDSKKTIIVPFKLIGTSLVKVNADEGQIYRISLLSDLGTIAIFKKMGNGYEVLEAKRVIEKSVKTTLIVTSEVDLILERALNQSKSNTILLGSDIQGHVRLTPTSISELGVELRNPNGETQNISIDNADLLDGGSFKADVNGEEVSGIVLNNGSDGYRISFVTGPIAGAMLNFSTKEQIEKIQESQSEKESVQIEVSPEEVKQANDSVIEERKEIAENVENQEPIEVLNAEEIKSVAENNGFSF